MKAYKFVKESRDWYIELPEFLENGGSKGDLQMVEGTDTLLDIISEGAGEVSLALDRSPFPGSDKLILTERCEPNIGGGYYNLPTFEGKEFNKTMWLCGVTEFVFGDLPNEIFIKRT
jgi:hypothetical protein